MKGSEDFIMYTQYHSIFLIKHKSYHEKVVVAVFVTASEAAVMSPYPTVVTDTMVK